MIQNNQWFFQLVAYYQTSLTIIMKCRPQFQKMLLNYSSAESSSINTWQEKRVSFIARLVNNVFFCYNVFFTAERITLNTCLEIWKFGLKYIAKVKFIN